jgi:hypothetical protein
VPPADESGRNCSPEISVPVPPRRVGPAVSCRPRAFRLAAFAACRRRLGSRAPASCAGRAASRLDAGRHQTILKLTRPGAPAEAQTPPPPPNPCPVYSSVRRAAELSATSGTRRAPCRKVLSPGQRTGALSITERAPKRRAPDACAREKTPTTDSFNVPDVAYGMGQDQTARQTFRVAMRGPRATRRRGAEKYRIRGARRPSTPDTR